MRIRSNSFHVPSGNEACSVSAEAMSALSAAGGNGFCSLLELTGDAIILESERGEVLYFNPAARRLLAFTAGGVGQTDVFQLAGQSGQELRESMSSALQRSGIWQEEMPIVNLAGEALVLEVKASALPDSGLVLLVCSDISDKCRWRQQSERFGRLEMVGTLAGGIAHDFNNILTAISGNVSLARLEGASSSEIRENLRRIEVAVRGAKQLAQQLLTFSRGGCPVKERASIGDLLRESSGFALRGRRSTCRYQFDTELFSVEMDCGQIAQVVENIIINADQAMSNGGVIEVACRNVVVPAAGASLVPLPPGPYVCIEIKDAGTGFPAASLHRVFQPYFTTRDYGVGLGLATSYAIVRKHGGDIKLESQEGQGSTFFIYLPATGSVGEVKAAPALRVAAAVQRVLVMDDQALIRETLVSLLQHLGYEAAESVDGEDAIERYQEASTAGTPFHAVIMDLTIPGGMGGAEALTRLKEIDPNVRAIVSSGYSNDPVMANFATYGFNGVIKKPYALKELGATLASVLQA